LPQTYNIKMESGITSIVFTTNASAIKNVPSIFSFDIFKFESGGFYGSIDHISPELDFEFIDTMLMMPWHRHLQDLGVENGIQHRK